MALTGQFGSGLANGGHKRFLAFRPIPAGSSAQVIYPLDIVQAAVCTVHVIPAVLPPPGNRSIEDPFLIYFQFNLGISYSISNHDVYPPISCRFYLIFVWLFQFLFLSHFNAELVVSSPTTCKFQTEALNGGQNVRYFSFNLHNIVFPIKFPFSLRTASAGAEVRSAASCSGSSES